jgi:hypothetical protein
MALQHFSGQAALQDQTHLLTRPDFKRVTVQFEYKGKFELYYVDKKNEKIIVSV